jgi:hypothetical protein
MTRRPLGLAFARILSLPLVTLACFGVGCDGGTGDPDVEVAPNVYGGGVRLADLIDPNADPAPINGANVNVTGVRVVHVDSFDETGTGAIGDVFLQDANDDPGPYQGLLAFRPATVPSSYRVLPGDIVDITGPFEFFPAPKADPSWPTRYIPEIGNGAISFRFDPVGPPIPRVIDANDLFDPELGAQWRGMLVTIENLKIGNTGAMPAKPEGWKPGDPGPAAKRAAFRFSIPQGTTKQEYEVPSVNNELFDLAGFYYNNGLATGTVIKRITGVVKVFGIYNIAPRSAADIELQ